MHAHKRKLRIVMMGLAKGGLTGAHIENLIRIELEKSGKGGLPNQGVTIGVMWGDTGYITSLVEWLDEVKLALHLPGMIYNSPMSVWLQVNGRYQMRGEQRSQIPRNEYIPIRSGQHWETAGGLLEVRSVKDDRVHCVRWTGLGKHQRKGATVRMEEADIRGACSKYSVGKTQRQGQNKSDT